MLFWHSRSFEYFPEAVRGKPQCFTGFVYPSSLLQTILSHVWWMWCCDIKTIIKQNWVSEWISVILFSLQSYFLWYLTCFWYWNLSGDSRKWLGSVRSLPVIWAHTLSSLSVSSSPGSIIMPSSGIFSNRSYWRNK